MLDLPAILKQAEATPPGPWHRSCSTVNTEDGGLVASMAHARPGGRKATAEFIAAARTNVPLLVAELEEVRGWRAAALEVHPELDVILGGRE